MLVSTSNGVATVVSPDGLVHSLPYEPLDQRAMLLQARYHLWCRKHNYRRALACTRCKESMETDVWPEEATQAWHLLTVCSCRAIYGSIPLSVINSATRT